MANIAQIQVEIFKKNTNNSTIDETICFDTNNLLDYINVLRKVQKNVNVELTKIVEQDKIDSVPVDEEDIEGLEDDSDDDVANSTCKRKLSSEKIKKKIKK